MLGPVFAKTSLLCRTASECVGITAWKVGPKTGRIIVLGATEAIYSPQRLNV